MAEEYKNSIVLVACYVCVADKILWIRRGIAPQIGRWALPGGYMEQGETPEEAACRELFEETQIKITADEMTLVSVSTLLHMAQTHLVFRCHLESFPAGQTSEEATELAWFGNDELPWNDVAFPSVEPQVRQMYSWLASGRYGIRIGFVNEAGSHYKHYELAGEHRSSIS